MEEKKYRTNNKTVEINTIEEEEIVNPKNKGKFIGVCIFSGVLFIYIIYLIIVIFIN